MSDENTQDAQGDFAYQSAREDPMSDIYKMMDQSGLDSTTMLSSRKPMSKIVSEVRTKLAMSLKSYITRREVKAFNEGKHDVPKKTEVKDE